MSSVCSPIMDPRRLAALRATALLDSGPEEVFERATRLATWFLKTPVSLVSLVDRDRQFFKSARGLPEPWASRRETPLTHSFCQYVVCNGQPLVVSDARRVSYLKDNLAVRDFEAIAYAGSPLVSPDGYTLGSFCVIDHRPRQWTEEELSVLHELAAFVIQEIELRAARRQLQDLVHEQKHVQAAVFESTSEGIYGIDRRGRFTFVNAAAAAMVGHKPEELIGKDSHQVIHHSRSGGGPYPREECPMWRAMEARESCRVDDEVFWRADGTSFPCRYTSSPIVENGEVTGAIVVFNDVTERKRAEEEVRRAKEALERASAAKDDFLAVISHELRTPLTPALMALSALGGDSALPAAVREELGHVRRHVALEAKLIDDLLDWMRLSRGQLELQREPMDVSDLLRQAVAMIEPEAARKGVQLSMALEAREHKVVGDPSRLLQVFWHLLSNAVKFTPGPGSVRVWSGNDASKRRLIIEIADTGVGISPELLPRLFHAFEQAERSMTRVFGGLGLGLTMARLIVEAHGGKITVASQGSRQGATFRIELPIGNRMPANAPPGRGPSLRLLLVEDHSATVTTMARLLRGLGHYVQTAANVREALDRAGKESFDLVISDIGLPDDSGWALMRQLRKRYGLPGIALSGFGMEADVASSREAGFAAHLTKPVDFRQLEEAIRAAAAVG